MRILAVDDEKIALKLLVSSIKTADPSAEVISFDNPKDALELVKNTPCDVAFLDIQMKHYHGIRLAQELKLLYPGINIVFATGYDEYMGDAFEMHASGYVMKPVTPEKVRREIADLRCPLQPEGKKRVRFQTFGYFEVFADGKPVIFEREKSKELLAYLVDRHGAAVTTEQIAVVLWEDIPYDRKLKNRVTATIAALKNSLKAAGSEESLIKTWNHLSLDISKIKCDAYDYEKWDAVAVNAFHGAYMLNDSWAEFTTGRYSQMK